MDPHRDVTSAMRHDNALDRASVPLGAGNRRLQHLVLGAWECERTSAASVVTSHTTAMSTVL
jgi:hypothetical protein